MERGMGEAVCFLVLVIAVAAAGIVEGEATQKVVNLTRSPMLVTAADPAVI